jgi:DnaK suppressor protein
MPAKRAAPKSVKGKKPAGRAAVRKPVARGKSEAATRVRAAVARSHKGAAVPRKPTPHANPVEGEGDLEMKKAARSAIPAAAEARTATTPTAPPRPAVLPGSDGEDGDAIEPGSLLAGPRNVQPYIAKRGELYMSKEQLEHFRSILNGWKRDLMEEVDRTVSHMKDEAANFPDPNDRATQEEEFSLELRTRDRERKLIRKIDDALKRIEDGSYGYCLETGEEIGIKRLEARPVATLSIEAQERRERRERQYGDRDDRYR